MPLNALQRQAILPREASGIRERMFSSTPSVRNICSLITEQLKVPADDATDVAGSLLSCAQICDRNKGQDVPDHTHPKVAGQSRLTPYCDITALWHNTRRDDAYILPVVEHLKVKQQ
jgi:hypothetical protein